MRPGAIGLTGAMRVEWLSSDPEDVVTFVERFASSRPDNLSKLRNSGAAERHLFVWGGAFPQDGASLRPLKLDIAALPSRAPNLPPEVTHVWVEAGPQERPEAACLAPATLILSANNTWHTRSGASNVRTTISTPFGRRDRSHNSRHPS